MKQTLILLLNPLRKKLGRWIFEKAFDLLDDNDDGYLTKSELRTRTKAKKKLIESKEILQELGLIK